MRHKTATRAALLVGAALLLVAGAPTAQARYGGSLLGGGNSSRTGGAYTPPPGSPERAAIMDALRMKVGEVSGKYVLFTIQRLRVQDGWARAVVRPQSLSGRTTYARVAAVLRRRGGFWAVTHIAEGASVSTDPATLRRLYPDAPPDIF